jgi:hypothetical protein
VTDTPGVAETTGVGDHVVDDVRSSGAVGPVPQPSRNATRIRPIAKRALMADLLSGGSYFLRRPVI